jgi:hypothetical protein
MSLLTEYDDWINENISILNRELDALSSEILKEGIKIFKGYVPIDTLQLKENIRGQVTRRGSGREIVIDLPGKNISYGNKVIQDIKLGMILEVGRGRNGVRLRRTKANEYAKKGNLTANWFTKLWIDASQKIVANRFSF